MTRDDLKLLVSNNIITNTSNLITASNVRQVLNTMIDSGLSASQGAFNVDVVNGTDGQIDFTFNLMHTIPVAERSRYMFAIDYLVSKHDRKVVRGTRGEQKTSVRERRWRCSLRSAGGGGVNNAVIVNGEFLSDMSVSECRRTIGYKTIMGERNDHADSKLKMVGGSAIMWGANHSTPIEYRGNRPLWSGGARTRYKYAQVKSPEDVGRVVSSRPIVYIRAAIIRYTGKSSTPKDFQMSGAYERVFVSSPVGIVAQKNGSYVNGIEKVEFIRLQNVFD